MILQYIHHLVIDMQYFDLVYSRATYCICTVCDEFHNRMNYSSDLSASVCRLSHSHQLTRLILFAREYQMTLETDFFAQIIR